MTRLQRWLILEGLALAVVGIVFGAIYGYRVHHVTLPLLRESWRAAFTAAAENHQELIDSYVEQGRVVNYDYVRVVDVHTHLIKLASVLVLVGIIAPIFVSRGFRARAIVALLLIGSVLFPSGVLGEIIGTGFYPKEWL